MGQGKAGKDLEAFGGLLKGLFMGDITPKDIAIQAMQEHEDRKAGLRKPCYSTCGDAKCELEAGHVGCKCPGKEPCTGCQFATVVEPEKEGV